MGCKHKDLLQKVLSELRYLLTDKRHMQEVYTCNYLNELDLLISEAERALKE